MRIAVFTDVFLEVPGGICSSIRAQRDGLVSQGHEVTIFCPGWHETAKHRAIINGVVDEGVVIVPTARHLKPGGAPLARAPEIVEQFIEAEFPDFGLNFDLVHVHYEAGCSIAGMRLARRFGLGIVQTMHGREDVAIQTNVPHPFKTLAGSVLNWFHGRYLPHSAIVRRDNFEGGIPEATLRGDAGFDFGLATTRTRAKMWTLMVNHANFADVVITPTKHFARKLQYYGMTTPVCVISNGVDDAMIEEFDCGGKMVREWRDGERLRLFWNSRVSSEKRILPMIEAVAMMENPVKLTVCGDGNELARAKKLVNKLKIADKVEFLGRVKHDAILEKMRGEHLSVINSFGFDTQSMTLLEAEATGLPTFFVDPDMAEVAPAKGSINCVKELMRIGWWKPGRREAPTAREIARVLDRIKPDDIKAMSKVMLKQRQDVLQSTQLKKLLAVYRELTKN